MTERGVKDKSTCPRFFPVDYHLLLFMVFLLAWVQEMGFLDIPPQGGK